MPCAKPLLLPLMGLTALLLGGIPLFEHVIRNDNLDTLINRVLENLKCIVVRCAYVIDDDRLEVQLVYRVAHGLFEDGSLDRVVNVPFRAERHHAAVLKTVECEVDALERRERDVRYHDGVQLHGEPDRDDARLLDPVVVLEVVDVAELRHVGGYEELHALEAVFEISLAFLVTVVDGVVETVLAVEVAVVEVESDCSERCAVEVARMVRQSDVVGQHRRVAAERRQVVDPRCAGLVGVPEVAEVEQLPQVLRRSSAAAVGHGPNLVMLHVYLLALKER